MLCVSDIQYICIQQDASENKFNALCSMVLSTEQCKFFHCVLCVCVLVCVFVAVSVCVRDQHKSNMQATQSVSYILHTRGVGNNKGA